MSNACPCVHTPGPAAGLALVLALGGLIPAAAVAEEANYLGITAGYMKPDSDRMTEDRGLGVQALYGWQVGDNVSLEARLFTNALETGGEVPVTPANGAGTDFYQYGAGFDLQYAFGGRRQVSPFLLIGLGGVYNDVVPDDNDAFGAYLNVGAGLVTRPMGSSGLKLRGEVRYVYDAFEDGMQDLHAHLGVEVPLRAPEPAAEPVERVALAALPLPTRPQDSDGDGVVDAADRCPDSLPGTAVDAEGCAERDQVITLRGVNFEFDSARLTPNAHRILDLAVDALEGDGDMAVEIAGHTDARGGESYNQRLSQARAEAVRDYLVAQGVAGQRLGARGYGEGQPIASNNDEAGRERNRRVEFRVLP